MPRNSTHTAVASSGLTQSRFGTLSDGLRRLRHRVEGGRSTATRDVIRHALILATGSSAARAVGVVSVPIITRLYTPEQFGHFALFLSFIALLTPLASLRYSAALPLPRRDRSAVALLLACLLFLGSFVVVLALLFASFSERLFALVSAQALASLWPLLLAGVAVAGLHHAIDFLSQILREVGIGIRQRLILANEAAQLSKQRLVACRLCGVVEFHRYIRRPACMGKEQRQD